MLAVAACGGSDDGGGLGDTPITVVERPDTDDVFGWTEFGDERVQTGSLEVPVDASDPSKGTFDLYLARHLADPDRRVGSLIVDPGGPGVAGADYAIYADQVFSDLGKTKSRADMLKMAEELIKSRAGSFDPGQFKNHYAEALRDLVKQKLASGGSIPVEDEKEPGGGKVIDFMEALKRSLKGGEKAPEKPAASTERAKPRSAARGKTAAKAKPAAKKKRA